MATYGQQSNSRPYLLLAGFIVLSVIAHGLFLASRFDDTPGEVELVQVAPPLHVVVVSTRGSTTSLSGTTTGEHQVEAPAKHQPLQPEKKSAIDTKSIQLPEKAPHAATGKSEMSLTDSTLKESEAEKNTPEQEVKETRQQDKQPTDADALKPVPVNHLQAQLRSQLARHFTYPRLARRMGWEGQVGLGLRIGEDGRLGNIQVVRSSGYKVLDENARSTLDRIGHITVASNRTINPVDTEIDVLYRLKD